MKIVCSTNMPMAREAFGTLGDVVILPERTLTAEQVRDADILAVRSTTKVNRDLLEGSRVRFVGTATIGYDHIDTAYLDSRGIPWCAAPGCNANSVSEYLVSALLCLGRRHGFRIEGLTLGVIGVGHVGRRIVEKAKALGLRVLQNDPPRERAEGREAGPFVSLDDLLAGSDVVTLHVPLTREGADATVGMAGPAFFDRMRRGAIFVNACRGPVVRNEALLAARRSGRVGRAAIDTWDPEPAFPADVLAAVDLGTPHIAGHSFEGKAMGTVIVYRKVCEFLGVAAAWTPDAFWPPPLVPEVRIAAAGHEDEEVLWDLVRRLYDIGEDDRALRAGPTADASARALHFDALRRHYPMRREFRFTAVHLEGPAGPALAGKIRALGFRSAAALRGPTG